VIDSGTSADTHACGNQPNDGLHLNRFLMNDELCAVSAEVPRYQIMKDGRGAAREENERLGQTNLLPVVAKGSQAQLALGTVVALGTSANGPAQVSVRPENIAVAFDEAGPGTVTAVSFVGANALYAVTFVLIEVCTACYEDVHVRENLIQVQH
jgi:hypothetical protein